jgi:hypothetical protein
VRTLDGGSEPSDFAEQCPAASRLGYRSRMLPTRIQNPASDKAHLPVLISKTTGVELSPSNHV